MPESLLTTEEVAELLRVHPKHVYRLLKRGLPARKVGGEWRFVAEEVLAWSGGTRGAGGASDRGAGVPPALLGDRPPLVAANGDVALEVLLDLANGRGAPLVGFVRSDRDGALALLAQGAVLAAGCHGAGFPAKIGEDRLARVHLVRREVGIAAKGPVPALTELHRLRFAGRPASAGVVVHFERALAACNAKKPKGSELGSHQQVASAVLRGEADAGLTTAAWAWRSGLAFEPLAREDYGLVVRAVDLGRPEMVSLCEVAQGGELRARLSAIPGYDASDAGAIRYDPA